MLVSWLTECLRSSYAEPMAERVSPECRRILTSHERHHLVRCREVTGQLAGEEWFLGHQRVVDDGLVIGCTRRAARFVTFWGALRRACSPSPVSQR